MSKRTTLEFLDDIHGYGAIVVRPDVIERRMDSIGAMYTAEEAKQFGLWLGSNVRKNRGKDIDELFAEFEKNRI